MRRHYPADRSVTGKVSYSLVARTVWMITLEPTPTEALGLKTRGDQWTRGVREAGGLRGQGGLGAFVRVPRRPQAPNAPFPHLNDIDTFRKMIRRRLTFALTAPIAAVSLVGLTLLLRR